MTCKVRRDFKIITDVSSRVSLVTSNIRGSSICSPKSLYQKTSNEILGELKAVFKTGALKVPEAPTRPTPVCYDLYSVTGVCQTAGSHPHPITTERKGEKDATNTNFSSCSDHSWIKTTAIFSPLTFVFEYFFLCRLLSLQHKTLVLWYIIFVTSLLHFFGEYVRVFVLNTVYILCFNTYCKIYIYIIVFSRYKLIKSRTNDWFKLNCKKLVRIMHYKSSGFLHDHIKHGMIEHKFLYLWSKCQTNRSVLYIKISGAYYTQKLKINLSSCPVGWGCRIHQLHLCRGVRPPSLMSVLDRTLNNLMARLQPWIFGECGVYLNGHRSQVQSGSGVVAPDRVLPMGQIEVFDI